MLASERQGIVDRPKHCLLNLLPRQIGYGRASGTQRWRRSPDFSWNRCQFLLQGLDKQIIERYSFESSAALAASQQLIGKLYRDSHVQSLWQIAVISNSYQV